MHAGFEKRSKLFSHGFSVVQSCQSKDMDEKIKSYRQAIFKLDHAERTQRKKGESEACASQDQSQSSYCCPCCQTRAVCSVDSVCMIGLILWHTEQLQGVASCRHCSQQLQVHMRSASCGSCAVQVSHSSGTEYYTREFTDTCFGLHRLTGVQAEC